jgi:hypothetical protein
MQLQPIAPGRRSRIMKILRKMMGILPINLRQFLVMCLYRLMQRRALSYPNSATKKNEIQPKMVNGLLKELMSMPGVSNCKIEFTHFNNSKSGCLINIPSHSTKEAFMKRAARNGNKWV